MIAPLAQRPLYMDVADRVRELIYQRELSPGDWIDEPELCHQLAISRTPMREALKVLDGENLVELVPRKGCRVRELEDDELLELFPVMASLEGLCADLATRKIKLSEITHLESLHAKLEQHAQAQDVDSYYEANRDFHIAVQNLAGNRWLQRITAELRNILMLARHRQLTLPGRLQESLKEHRAIIQALKAGDPKATARAMHNHLSSQERALRKEKQLTD
jgi:DNA-binding GntR family transcriptional regulator